MTVQNLIVKNIASGNGSTRQWPFTFACPVDHPEYIKVYIKGSSGKATATNDFSVNMTTKYVTYPVAGNVLASGEKIIIARELPLHQILNLVNQGPFYAEDLEVTYDELVMMVQQLNEQLQRSLKVGIDIDQEREIDITIPVPTNDSNYGIRITKNGFELVRDPQDAYDAAVAQNTAAIATMNSIRDENVQTTTGLKNEAEAAKTAAQNAASVALESKISAQAADTHATNVWNSLPSDYQGVLLRTDGWVNIKEYGAVGDGVADDTAAFNLAQTSGKNIFVPKGNYKVSNLVFSTSQTWYFEPSSRNHWFDSDGACISTDTATKVTKGAIIYNLRITYNGTENDISKRPICLEMMSHWAELHRFYQSHFYIGIDFATEGHCDYTRIYNANCWYNYYCGVRLDGAKEGRGQVNFISLFDCNIGATGVDVHNRNVEPNIARGYAFYIGTCNSVYINNGDFSANETCAFYINNSNTLSVTRSLKVSTFYAEHNKYCDVYYLNSTDNSGTRTRDLYIESAYLHHDSTDIFFVGRLYMKYPFLPPTVKLLQHTLTRLEDCYSPELTNITYCPKTAININKVTFFATPQSTYKLTFKIKGLETGRVYLQPLIYGAFFNDDETNFFGSSSRLEIQNVQSISLTENVITTYTTYLTTPASDYNKLQCFIGGYGVNNQVISGSIEKLPSCSVVNGGTPLNGITRVTDSGAYQVYINNEWKTITVT